MEKKSRKYNIVAFIPLRAGSKSIPLKNIKEIAGKPLAFWVIEAALGCHLINKVYVSTDSEKIKNKIDDIKNKKLEIVNRSKKTATDKAPTELAMLEFAKKNSFEHIVLIQATSPLLEPNDLYNGLKKYLGNECDSLLSVVRQKRFIWEEKNNEAKPLNYNPQKRPRRQEFNGFLVENGAFYITSRERLLESGCRISGKICIHEMPEETYFELDEPSDWIIIEELLIRKKKHKDIKNRVKKIKMVIFDVDGIFTDGSVYLDNTGKENLKFSRIDGKGIELLNEKGYKIAVISSEESEIVRKRMEKLQIKDVHLGVKNKLSQYKKLIEKYKLKDEEICFCGDDVQDIPVLKKVGLSACPRNALDEVKGYCDYVSIKKGGEGFVRDIVDLINLKNIIITKK